MRENTRGTVLAALLRSRPASRKQLAEATGISAATVSRTVDNLIAEGLVHEGPAIVEERRGRRQVLLDIATDDRVVVGLDLGASRTRCVVADMTASPLATMDVATPTDLTAPELAHWVADLARTATAHRWPHVRAVAIGLPGAVGHDRTISNAPNLPQVEHPGFVTACEEALGRPLAIDNDANAALLGEQRFGAAAGLASAAMVTLGAGLGVGLAVNGRILQGRRGLVGEFGQLPTGPHGARLETMVTGPAIVERAAEFGLELDGPAALFSLHGNAAADRVRARFDQALLMALASVSVACDPDVIVIGGGIAKSLRDALPTYQRRLRETLHVAPHLAYTVLGDFAGASGAVVAALHLAYADLGVEPASLAHLPAAGTLTASSLAAVSH
ncbi:ROK family transcriptional regulator [Demequina globuliformis]|uniref:ROK family transcriptional regulator n=1 Tax=Demequina globuliformis TaxID=676202 RepID=UPI0007854B41|nr:ROK family transcriptional regulator [Demequina globuliformis]